VDTQQATKMRKSRSKSHPTEAFILTVWSAVSQPDALASLVSPFGVDFDRSHQR
jgi:hypothetical protein